MKILYGINTNGQGHINRARGIIQQLQQDGNQVDLLFSGPQPPHYAKRLASRWRHIDGYIMRFSGHTIDIRKTLFANIRNFRSFPRLIWTVRKLVQKEDYDALITDFDSFTSLAGLSLRKPVISIDHQHSLIHPSADWAPGNLFDIASGQFVVFFCCPYFTHAFCIDYVKKPKQWARGTLFPLFWKHDLDKYHPTVEDHYCVYLKFVHPKRILRVFRQFSNETFKVYGYDRSETLGNVEFKPTSRHGFLKDMASSKGVISHAGFSLTWETMMLKKPLYSIPLAHHYEQITNAYRLSKLDLAYFANHLTEQDLETFIRKAGAQNFQAPAVLPIVSPALLTKAVYYKIEEITGRELTPSREDNDEISTDNIQLGAPVPAIRKL